jgi:prephenate dehydratase
MALPGTRIQDISEVHSHPMALAQCKSFLGQHKHWQKIEREDTALCAAEISLRRKKNFAAVASELAAKEYGLDIVAASIETNKQNFTRFLILSRDKNNGVHSGGREKVSVCFSLKHEPGSLNELLSMLASRSCNLTKIQSAPIIGKEFQYFFFVDFILENNSYEEVMKALEDQVESLKILGHYKEGSFYES